MTLPAGHARRLFLGFTCSIMFLVVFALLIAYNTEAESSALIRSAVEDYPLTIGIPTSNPEGTISFYKKLGFNPVKAFPRVSTWSAWKKKARRISWKFATIGLPTPAR